MKELKQMYKTIMADHFPDEITVSFGQTTLTYKKCTWKIKDEKTAELVEKGLRYGENPDQEAAIYKLTGGNLSVAGCEYINAGNYLVGGIDDDGLIQSGKHPGKTNLTDIDSALNILKFLMDKPSAVIIKHNNPCGVASAATLMEAYEKANMADRIAAFGGCLALNRPVDAKTASLISENYLEVVAAPEYEEGAVGILSKRKNLRVIKIKNIDNLERFRDLRYIDFKALIDGSLIVQQSQINKIRQKEDLERARCTYKGKEYAIERPPTDKEYEDMLFGWYVEQGVTSNSVIYVKDCVTVGIGTGEQDRVGVAEIAAYKAYTKYADAVCFRKHGIPYKTLELEVLEGKRSKEFLNEIDDDTKKAKGGLIGSAMVSDAFFPFRDGVDVGISQGVTAVIQPGGSERDFEVIEACNSAKPEVTMVFTGQRVFKH
ncbi:MAG: hypothetical protein L3V56_08735 [Candidatus Magnetoovum sp. WYHC-5]|nr:hypothetical protein [Candidatus Magnetoovum sp. WYHC-5]